MKKIFISSMSIILILSIMFIGCGGNKSSGRSSIKIFEVKSGDVGYVPDDLNHNGVVFADSLSEIGNEYMLLVPNYSISDIRGIQAVYYDDNGNKQNVIVSLTIDNPNIFENFTPLNIIGGGTSVDLQGKQPGGKGVLTANYNGLIRQVNIWVYNSWGTLSSGVKINSDGTYLLVDPTLKMQCAFYYEVPNKILIGQSYHEAVCNMSNWKEVFKSIKTINESRFIVGSENQIFNADNVYNIYISKIPDNGYIKIIQAGEITVWEHTSSIDKGFN